MISFRHKTFNMRLLLLLVPTIQAYYFLSKGALEPFHDVNGFTPSDKMFCNSKLISTDPPREYNARTETTVDGAELVLEEIGRGEFYLLKGRMLYHIGRYDQYALVSDVQNFSFDHINQALYWINGTGLYTFTGFVFEPRGRVRRLDVNDGHIILEYADGSIYLNQTRLAHGGSACFYVLPNVWSLKTLVLSLFASIAGICTVIYLALCSSSCNNKVNVEGL